MSNFDKLDKIFNLLYDLLDEMHGKELSEAQYQKAMKAALALEKYLQ